METLVRVHELSKHFGDKVAVDQLSFTVNKGEVLGFLGPNGAGKSTTMKMIAGFLLPTHGRVEVCGFDVWDKPLEAKENIGYVPEGAPSYPDMSVVDFLTFAAKVRGYTSHEAMIVVGEAVEKTSLDEVLDQRIETLSKGFKRRVGLAQALLHDPEVLIMDEPTDGLDPNQKHHIRQLILEMANDKAIIISTHILEEVDAVCTRAMIINKGKIVLDGDPEKIQAFTPEHNAVELNIEAKFRDRVVAGLEEMASIKNVVDVKVDEEAQAGLLIYPNSGKNILEEVHSLLAAKRIRAIQIRVVKGKLDHVFRHVTKDTVEEGVMP